MSIITPASLPASAQLLLAIDPQGDGSGGSGVESPFSALLEAEIGAGLAMLAGEAAPAAASGATSPESPAPASGKATGKPGGKILPDRPHFAAETLPDIAAGNGLPGASASPAGVNSDPDADPDPARPVDAAALPVLPAAVFTLTAPPVARIAVAAAPTRSASQLPGTAQPVAGTPGQRLPAEPALADAPALRVEQVPPALPAGITLPIQPVRLAAALLVPFKLPVSEAPTVAPIAPAEGAEPSAAAALPPPAQFQSAPLALAPLPQRMVQLARGEAREAAATAEMRAPAASEDFGKPLAAPLVLVQPESPPLLAASQSTSPTSPAVAPSVPGAASAVPAPHDFAGLIDRLVEARQAAQTTLATQTVTAALTHAEFGQVSLQFRQDADGLSVVMAGADPDLARAVQVAAPAAAAQTGGNSDSNASARQDSGGQQSASANQTQSQAQQHRSQSSQRFAEEPRGSANPSPRQRSQNDPSARGGIFA